MFSFATWPRFPSVSLPATIQRRFLSFILKRSLGHLVKPGQLDPAQIDAQIGSGFVQVNDVELDHHAINEHLADLPLPFILASGSIGKVSARIPWPNLFTAPLTLSLSSLSLTFVHSPRASSTAHAKDDLAESVASMAESFVHDELSARENEALRKDLHVETSPRHMHQPPGSMDPFLSTEDVDSGRQAEGYNEGEDAMDDADPSAQGVSLIATLIERLLARFEIDASDITVRVVLPGKAEFVLRLGQITYSTEDTFEPTSSSTDRGVYDGAVRTIKVVDISISTRDLTPPPAPLSTTTRQGSASPSNSSSSSDEDEDAMMMMMSQSLASLPTRRSISPETTMYHSATSSVHSLGPETALEPEQREPVEEKIMALGHGPDPVVFRFVTPQLVVPPTQMDSVRNPVDKLRLTVTVGPVAVALNPIHARSLCHLSSALSRSPSAKTSANPPQDSSTSMLEFAFHFRSVTLLLFQLPSPFPASELTINGPLGDFFLTRPTPSSSLRTPHIRLQFDVLEISSTPPVPIDAARHTNSTPASATADLGPLKNVLKASLADVSVFAFASSTGRGLTASPILISDPNLSTQYEHDTGFPSFDVIDWTKVGDVTKAGKTSQWRMRPSQGKRKSGDIPSTATGTPRVSHVPTLQAHLERGFAGKCTVCEVDVVPLHLFIDVGIMEGAFDYMHVVTASGMFSEQGDMRPRQDLDETSPATPRARGSAGWQVDKKERKRLEDLIINDFTTSDDVDFPLPTGTVTNLGLRIALLRVEVRVPPPPTLSASLRSGALVLDLHGVQLTQEGEVPSSERHTKHVDYQGGSKAGLRILGRLKLRRLLAATTLPGGSKASTFCSIAAQASTSEISPSAFGIGSPLLAHSPPPVPLPSICFRSNPVLPHGPSTISPPGAVSSFSLDAHLPMVHVSLSKPVLDGLTFWADDITQCLYGDVERASTSDTSGRSRDPSMIGSRFFAKRTASTGSSESGREGRKSEFVAKAAIGRVQIELLVPRKDAEGKSRPLIVDLFDVDLLAEIKPEGKDETVVTVGVMDLKVSDKSAAEDIITILSLTIPRDVIASSRSFIKLRYISVVDNDTAAKESRLKLSISGFTYFLTPDMTWAADVALFAKAPEGAFESVIPSERTKVSIKVMDGSFHAAAPNNLGALVVFIGELDFLTDLVGDSQEMVITTIVSNSRVFFIDDISNSSMVGEANTSPHSVIEYWKQSGYALLAEADDVGVRLRHLSELPMNTQVQIDSIKLKLHACADTIPAFGSYSENLVSMFADSRDEPSLPRRPAPASLNQPHRQKRDVFASVDEHAFRRAPDLGPAPDMIRDDLPTNLDYLDASFGAAAGLRELRDDDLFDFEPHEAESGRNTPTATPGAEGVISNLGGETIRMLDPRGIRVVEGHFENIPQEITDISSGSGDAKLSVRMRNCDVTVSLYDGYDWVRTRKTIEQEVKAIRRRLVKIRQLLASGQAPDDSIEETSAILFNSVSIGLPQDPGELEPGALIAAIDEELNDDAASESASQSSWQSFKPRPHQGTQRLARLRGRKVVRSKGSQIDFCLSGIQAEVDQFHPNASLVSRVLVTVKDLEILDHIKTSTWKKFLTELRTDFRGNVRETDSDMIRGELRIVHPVPDVPTEEGRLRVKVLPIKLHVDQDALDFMKKFFSFQNPGTSVVSESKTELYFQHVEVFPVDLKLDYKPKRVDYKALREGKTIELMNFFHFDGAEITLRHITLSGITGWPRLFDTLNDLWTPDVKANQLADIISGVSPVRSLVNVGSGVADLVLLPIAQYKKDKRVVRGVQKGTTSFVKSTAMEAIKLGAQLATGTQVILEQAETVLGGQGQFKDTITAEALQAPHSGSTSDEESEVADLISRYADQPQDVREGMQSAYKSLSRNFNSAAQTILAVPMEVYERSGNEGPVRAIVRAVPIAVLKPMIGASEAVSKTLFGLRNTMDPEVKRENEAKYKQR